MPYCGKAVINIINTSILDNVYPEIWKKAIITPLCKISKPLNNNDLRPVSILPAISKIIEKHLHNQIVSFVDSNKLIPECQSGFRKNYSTTTCLLKLVNDIRTNQENKNMTCLSLLDFSKAFDTLDHSLLLAKLQYFGFSDGSLELIKNLLKDRSHCVVMKRGSLKQKSSYIPMISGVPQGSILGPLLFSLYVADMNKELQFSELQQYADDSQIYCRIDTNNLAQFQLNFNDDLNKINKYALDHNLKLNAGKSCVIVFGSDINKITNTAGNMNIHIDNVAIPIVTETKNLGIYFDAKLSFQAHITTKLKAAYIRLKNFSSLKKYIPSKTKYQLCDTLILSLFDYGDVVYGTSINARFSRKIQILQNSCLRFSFNIPFRDHITPHLKNLSILSMTNRRQFHLMTFIYRILTTEQPPYLFSLFHYVDHDHSTRQVHYFKIPQHRTANFQKSFSFIAPHLWNNISNNFKFQSFTDYKKQIKNHLLNS